MSTADPLISVIMPVYNGEQFIRETIDSVLNQTFRNYEFIIVNDGSIDSTEQIIDSYDDKRIIHYNLARNQGVSNARNMGIDISKGKYIAFCDADDIYASDRFEIQFDFLSSNPSVDVCGSYFTVIENDHEVLIKNPITDEEIKEHLFCGNCIGQPSVMGKSSVFRRYKYNIELQASEDYDLWTRMAVNGVNFANIPLPLVKYRIHPAQASKTKGRLLHITSKTILNNYALAYLNNNILSVYSKAKSTSITEFRKFISELAIVCNNKSKEINIFRPLIALQYNKLEKLNIKGFLILLQMSSRYHIDFPAKYLFNIFLLCFIPINRNSSLYDTLTKLKL